MLRFTLPCDHAVALTRTTTPVYLRNLTCELCGKQFLIGCETAYDERNGEFLDRLTIFSKLKNLVH